MKTFSDILRKRAEVTLQTEYDLTNRAFVKELSKRDPKYFIDMFAWTFDPRAEGNVRHRPFILYPFQRDEIDKIEQHFRDGKDMLTEKSRDMGVSWLYAAWLFHKWLFEKDFTALIGSRKEDLVDNRQTDSLFGKLDYLIRFCPKWILPAGFELTKHRLALKLINPENGNTILGESANPDFSRGGRYSVILFDEFAFWDWADRAWSAAGDASKVKFPVSTPNGSNFFKFLRFSGKIDVSTINWKLHPDKDEAWYANERKKRLPEDMAQEVDIAYERSNKGRVYEDFEMVPYGKFEYNEHWPVYVSWDYGLSDDTAIIWWQRDPVTGRRRIIDCYWKSGKLIDYFVPFITGEIPSGNVYEYTADENEIIQAHREYKPAIHFGDPAGKQRHQAAGNKSVIDQLREFGIHVHTKDDSTNFEIRKTKSKLLMRELDVNDNARTRYLRECMLNSRYPVRRDNTQSVTVPVKPIHDWTSHLRSAFEYYAVNERDYRVRRSIDPQQYKITKDKSSKSILY